MSAMAPGTSPDGRRHEEPVRVLLVEDATADAALIQRALTATGLRVAADVARTPDEVAERLRSTSYDIVLSAYTLPGWTGMDVLGLLRDGGQDLPLILVTGQLGDELAVDCVRRGASDYILKDRLEDLPEALERVLQEKAAERARARTLRLLQMTGTVMYALDPVVPPFTLIWLSDNVKDLLGHDVKEELEWTWWLGQVHPADRDRVAGEKAGFGAQDTLHTEYRFLHADGTYRWIRDEMRMVRDQHGQPQEVLGVLMDITYRREVDEERRAAQERLHGLFESATDGIAYATLDGILVDFNEAFREITGYSREELLDGRRYQDFTPPEYAQRDTDAVRSVLETGESVQYVKEYIRKDGTRIPVRLTVWPVRGQTGEPVGLAGMVRDITTQLTEERTRERAQALLDHTTDFVAMADPTGQVIFLNPGGRTLLGVPHDEEVSGTSVVDYVLPRVAESVTAEAIPAAIRDGTWAGELELLARDGRPIPCSAVAVAHTSGSGEVEFLSLIARDISESRSTHAALKEQQERLLRAQRVAHMGFLDLDLKSKAIEWSDEVYRLYGVDPEESVDLAGTVALIHPDDRERVEANLGLAMQGLEYEAVDHRIVRDDGSVLWVHSEMELVLGEDGTPRSLLGTIVDITERMQAEGALRLFRTLVDHSTDAIEVIDPDSGRFLDVNETGSAVLGYSREELLELSVPDIDPAIDSNTFSRSVRDIRRSGPITLESVHRRKDGSAFPVEVNVALVSLDRDYIVAVSRDITTRQRDEAERALLSAAIEQAAYSVVITDSEGTIQYVNRAFERFTGYTKTEVIGQNRRILKSGKHNPAFHRSLWETVKRGETWTSDIVQRAKDGTLLHLRETIFPVADPEGKTTSFVAMADDTSRERSLEAQLNQAQKMEAIGRLAGGVAHDFNNVLSVISVTTELLLADSELGAEKRQDLEQIKAASGRAATLTRQLLAFSRRQTMDPRVLDLNAVVAGVQKMLLRLIGEDVDFDVALAPDLGSVEADPGQIEQVIMNLVVNARDAMPEGGHLTIETANVDLDDAYAATHAEVNAGPYVMVAVTDSGTGMDAAALAQAFEPFFTTKELGEGTGLGLATVYGIVKQSRGHVAMYSEPGVGTTVNVYLPRTDAEPDADTPRDQGLDIPGGSARILVAEDDAVVRDLLVRILGAHGYRVMSAANGEEALKVVLTSDAAFDLLITDVIMPGGTGLELSRRLGLRTLFISGYPGDAVGRHGVLDPGVSFLRKPFSKDDLARKVHEILSAE